MKRLILFIAGVACFFQAFGCGTAGLTPTDQKLAGQWVAEKLNSQGDRILITFAPSGGSSSNTGSSSGYTDYSGILSGGGGSTGSTERNVSLTAIRPAGDTYNVDAGSYVIDGNKLSFAFNEIPGFSSPFTVSAPTQERPGQLTIGTDVYFKVTGTLSAPQLGGQIQVSQAASDESVTAGALTLASSGGSPGGSTQGPAYQGPLFVSGDVIIRKKHSGSSHLAGLSVEGASATGDDAPPYQILKITLPEDHAALSVDEEAPKSLNELPVKKIKYSDDLKRATIDAVKNCPADMECGYNMILRTQSLSAPTDPHFNEQWNLNAMSVTDAWGIVGAAPAREVVCAVIDTGALNHPDLAGRWLMSDGYDFVHDKIDGIPDLDLDSTAGADNDPTDPGDHNSALGLPGGSSWHGPHIAGIIAASIDNATGMAGIATRVKILPLRAMGFQGNGTLDDVAQAIRYAAKLKNIADCGAASYTAINDGPNGGTYSINTASTAWTTCNPSALPRKRADIINLSLGAAMTTTDADLTLNPAINDAVAAGVLVVASAGNEAKGPGWCIDETTHHWVQNSSCNFYPAANPNVISIGAVRPNLSFASNYSNFGSDSNNTQFLVAPGGSSASAILSTVNTSVLGGYAQLMGTSQAAAHVSGVAALVLSEHPAWTDTAGANKVKEALRTSAVDLGAPGRDIYYGYGLVNACGAVMKARQLDGMAVSGTSALTVSSQNVNFGPLGKTSTVLITGGCGGAPISFTAAKSPGNPWLKTTLGPSSTPSRLTLDVDRASLAQGDYSATVTLTAGSATKTINISMKVGPTSYAAGGDDLTNLRHEIEGFLSGSGNTGYENQTDVGEVVIILINADTGQPANIYTKTDLSANYNFQFGGIPPGRYYILGGVDQNLDGSICIDGGGEPCFSYPNLANPEVFQVDASTKKTDIALVY